MPLNNYVFIELFQTLITFFLEKYFDKLVYLNQHYLIIQYIENLMSSKEICLEVQTNQPSSPFSLQKIYQQLSESIKERLQALALHHQLHNIKRNTPVIPQKAENLKYVRQSHRQMQNFYSENLLRHQISIQEQEQIKSIIKNYEQRIHELRSHLVNKEAEISYEMYEKKRSSLLKKQNMVCYNNQIKLQKEIKNTLEQMKRLKVEIQAMEYTIDFYQPQQPTKETTQATSLSLQKYSQNLSGQSSKEKVNVLQKDKNLSKIMVQLNAENARHEILKEIQSNLKKQYESMKTSHNECVKQYNQQRNNSQGKGQQNFIDLMDKSFTKNEQQQTQKPTPEGLFIQKDVNRQEQPMKVETKNRKITLKQKRSRRLTKQN